MTAEARTYTERVPRLARENWRVWLATGISIPVGFAASIGYGYGYGPRAFAVTAAALGLTAALVIALSDTLRVQAAIVTLSLLSVAIGWT